MFKDGHHILHERQEWSLRPQARTLRETPSLIVRMDRSLHNEIHSNCPPIPLLGYHALNRTLSAFRPSSDTMATLDSLMLSIERASNHPKAHNVERELASLAIEALDLQRPYIQFAVGRTAA